MSRKETQQTPDLTSPEAFKKGQKVYDRMVSGQCMDVTAELHATFGTKPKRG